MKVSFKAKRRGDVLEMEQTYHRLFVCAKRCKLAASLDGFTDAGIVGYFIKLPFKWWYNHQFKQLGELIDKANEQGLTKKLAHFEEYDNESILYGPSQLQALAYKQYDNRLRYFEKLMNDVSERLKEMDEDRKEG